MAHQHFYSFPEQLLKLIIREIGPAPFDPKMLEMELKLSRLVGDYSMNVGVYQGAPIVYEFLAPMRPLRINFDDVKDLGWGKTEAEIKSIERIGNPRLKAFHDAMRGYCGWLMTNREYVDALNNLLRENAPHLRKNDFPRPILASFGQPLPESQSDESWVGTFRAFFSRWRLQTLIGPGLPRPLPPMVPSFPAFARTLAVADGAASIVLPDIVPVSGRGVLLGAIEDAVHGAQVPDHLSGWQRIIGWKNPAKNAIERFSRLFALQHYWHLLHSRHPAAVKRNTTRLTAVFAEFLEVSDDSIRKDLRFIARRLGKGWERLPSPLA